MSSHDSVAPAPDRAPATPKIWVNGAIWLPAAEGTCTLTSLLGELGLGNQRVAVALNRSVVPRSRYGTTPLASGDRVEILEAVGGG